VTGSGIDRMLHATPAADMTGSATITLPITAPNQQGVPTTTNHVFKLVVGAGSFRDGGFEEPSATASWSTNPAALANLSLVADGTTRAHVARVASGRSMAVQVTLDRDTLYRLDSLTRFDAPVPAGSPSAWIRVLDGSTQLAGTTHTPAQGTAWTLHDLEFRTPPGTGTITVTVQIIDWNQTARLLVDDVSVVRP
jgi:hypothetical protein